MLKDFMKYSVIAAALASGGAHAQPYITAGGDFVRTADGACLRTAYWTPELASAECDPQLTVKVHSTEVLFAFDDDRLDADALKRLDELGQKLFAMEVEKVVAVGHADSIGASHYNRLLSVRRVWAVRDYLAAKGITIDRMTLDAKGDREPVAGSSCEFAGLEKGDAIACLRPDRRVMVEVTGRPKPGD